MINFRFPYRISILQIERKIGRLAAGGKKSGVTIGKIVPSGQKLHSHRTMSVLSIFAAATEARHGKHIRRPGSFSHRRTKFRCFWLTNGANRIRSVHVRGFVIRDKGLSWHTWLRRPVIKLNFVTADKV